jgi:phosphate-selective porin OprO/OprP
MKSNFRRIHRLAAVAAVIGTQFHAPHARAADVSNENVQALIDRVKELEQKVKVLERNREVDQEITTEKGKAAPIVTLGANGLVVRSADSNFVFNVHGYVQTDARFYFDDPNTANDTFLIRRARPIFEGTLWDKFDYRVMIDVGTAITSSAGTTNVSGNNAFLQDGYVNARLWPQFQIQAGKYKEPVGLERLQSGANLLFVERGFPTQLVPNRDVGFEIHNDLFNAPLTYAIGIFNGVTDGGSGDFDSTDEGKDVAGRVFAQPFLNTDKTALRGLGFGVAGTVGQRQGTPRVYTTPGQQTFFSYASSAANTVSDDGRQYRISPQGFYYWGPFGLLAEYVISSQELKRVAGAVTERSRLRNRAWQVEASYFLTGEQSAYNTAVSPIHPFGLDGGGWGAFQVAARVGQLSIDPATFPRFAAANSAREATSWGVGLNWYLNRNIKLNLDYENTTFRAGSSVAGTVTSVPEHVILSRVQFSF